MKKFIIYLTFIFFAFGCVNKIKTIQPENKVSAVEVVSFDNADIDDSGEISKQEFNNIQKQGSVNYIDPMWGFYGVIGMVAILLTLSNFIQSKKRNKENG